MVFRGEAMAVSKIKLGYISGFYLLKRDMRMYEELPKHGVDVTVFSNTDYKDIGPLHIPVVHLKRWGQYNRIPVMRHGVQYFFPRDRWLFGLNKATQDMDVLNSFEIFNAFSYQAVQTGKPTVISVIDNIPYNYRFSYRKMVETVKEKAAHFIAGTETAKFMLRVEGVPEERISVIPLAQDTQEFTPGPKDYSIVKGHGITSKHTIILFVGRVLDSQKGVSDLIHAFSVLCKKRPNTRLVIGGKGEDLDKMKELVRRLNIEKYVVFLGFVPNLVKLYRVCDIFCGPSRITSQWQEQFGYTMIEAMSCAKPVVTTHSGSLQDVVKHEETGLLVGIQNPYALYQALLRLVDDPERREQFGKNGRKWVESQYALDVVAKKMAAVFKKVV